MNHLALALFPVALAVVLLYSYSKPVYPLVAICFWAGRWHRAIGGLDCGSWIL